MKSIKHIAAAILISVAAVVGFSFIGQNHASALFTNARNQACGGVNLSNSKTTCANESASVGSLVNTIINIISWIVGIAAILMVIVGGFRYVISGGDSNATASARNTIIYALIGLAIAAMAQLLIHFVLNQVNKSVTPVTEAPRTCIQWDNYTAGLCDKYSSEVTSQPIIATTVSSK